MRSHAGSCRPPRSNGRRWPPQVRRTLPGPPMPRVRRGRPAYPSFPSWPPIWPPHRVWSRPSRERSVRPSVRRDTGPRSRPAVTSGRSPGVRRWWHALPMRRLRRCRPLPPLGRCTWLSSSWRGTVLVGPASAANLDTDGDGLPDWYERDKTRTSPTLVDSDGDGIRDEVEDLDGDRLRNLWEQRSSTAPAHRRHRRRRRPRRPRGHRPRPAPERRGAGRATPTRSWSDTDGDGFRDAERGPTPGPTRARPPPSRAAADARRACRARRALSDLPGDNVWNVPIDGRPVARIWAR